MLENIKSLVRNHTLLSIYTVVFLGLLYGVYVTSGGIYIPSMLLYIFSLFGFYLIFFFFQKRSKKEWLIDRLSLKKEIPHYYLTIPVLLVLVVLFITLGHSPPISAIGVADPNDISLIRDRIFEDAHYLIKYASSFCIKGALPFLVLYLYLKDHKLWYWIILIVGAFYAFSMMQKSYIFVIILPVLVYVILEKKYLQILKYIVIISAYIISLSIITNPHLEDGDTQYVVQEPVVVVDTNVVVEDIPVEPLPSNAVRILNGLTNRVLVVPGEMVSRWFEHVPKDKPFLYGDGYRLVALLKGVQYQAYASQLYEVIYPTYHAMGLQGSVNVASFMYDYANFGTWGLVLSGFILALLFLLIERIFKNSVKLKLSMNIYPVLFLSSSALTTMLFSGGWMLLILFFFIFLKRKETA